MLDLTSYRRERDDRLLEGIRDELTAPQHCKVGQWAQKLEEKDIEIFVSLVHNENISAEILMRKLQSVGADFGLTTLKTHRRKECICWKALNLS